MFACFEGCFIHVLVIYISYAYSLSHEWMSGNIKMYMPAATLVCSSHFEHAYINAELQLTIINPFFFMLLL